MEEQSVFVTVRVRPAGGADGEDCWDAATSPDTLSQIAGKHTGERFRFDAVCGPETHTIEVYERAAKEVVAGLLVGRSGTVVAYGQTASGKTHTTQGFMRLACEQLFDESGGEVVVWASYLEVYDDALSDLLDARAKPAMKEDRARGVHLHGAHEVRIASPDALHAVVTNGERRRHRGATRLNSRSSRSHAVLRLRVATDVRGVCFEASLCVVDLAGSERPRKRRDDAGHGQRAWVASKETRFDEGVAINKSLTALNHVLRQMGDKGVAKPSFRNSTLTRLLQPTLQGAARLALVCCVAPGSTQLEETRRTLQFGRRAARAAIRAATPAPRAPGDPAAARAERLERENLQLARAVAAKAAALEEKARRIKALEALARTGEDPAVAKTRRRASEGCSREGPRSTPADLVALAARADAAEKALVAARDAAEANAARGPGGDGAYVLREDGAQHIPTGPSRRFARTARSVFRRRKNQPKRCS
mmetsp:Transcript_12682/g.39178  ORF Transcript_12682/g.39178 Transcript_12682/m.39178 type:complete len:479 (-) Transcript_12682:2367-3803(-)